MLQIAIGLYTRILVLSNDTANTSLNITDFHDMYVWLAIPVKFISSTGY